MTALPEYDLDLKLAELKINGYVTFEGLIPVETIDRIREAFLPLLEEVKTHSNTQGEDVRVRAHTDDRLVVEGSFADCQPLYDVCPLGAALRRPPDFREPGTTRLSRPVLGNQ